MSTIRRPDDLHIRIWPESAASIDEAPGRVIEDPATHMKKKIYRGMTSPEAVLETLYDSGDSEALDAALAVPPEGQEIQVPYRGSVSSILQRIRGHLQSSVSYGGEITLAAVREKVLPDPTAFLDSGVQAE